MADRRKRVSNDASDVSRVEKIPLTDGFSSTYTAMALPSSPSSEIVVSRTPSVTKPNDVDADSPPIVSGTLPTLGAIRTP